MAHLPAFLRQSPLLVGAGLQADADQLLCHGTRLVFGPVRVNSYHAVGRQDRVPAAGARGRFPHLPLFVATEDPEINISRVQHRVRTGGHPVPTDKIVSRYHRSLALLPEALAHTSRAYVFDNSGHERVWVAEITDGVELEIRTNDLPAWCAGALGLELPFSD